MSMHPERNYFKEFKSDCQVFIETGTYKGAGIQLAFDAGFLRLISIDIVNHPVTYRYPGVGDVKLYIDHSPTVLSWLLPTINEKCLFWLDAHSQQFEGEEDNYPLLDELAQIAKHKRKDHVILIDDMLMMTHPDVTGWSRQTVVDAILKINTAYKIEFLPNPVKNNILLAHV